MAVEFYKECDGILWYFISSVKIFWQWNFVSNVVEFYKQCEGIALHYMKLKYDVEWE